MLTKVSFHKNLSSSTYQDKPIFIQKSTILDAKFATLRRDAAIVLWTSMLAFNTRIVSMSPLITKFHSCTSWLQVYHVLRFTSHNVWRIQRAYHLVLISFGQSILESKVGIDETFPTAHIVHYCTPISRIPHSVDLNLTIFSRCWCISGSIHQHNLLAVGLTLLWLLQYVPTIPFRPSPGGES